MPESAPRAEYPPDGKLHRFPSTRMDNVLVAEKKIPEFQGAIQTLVIKPLPT